MLDELKVTIESITKPKKINLREIWVIKKNISLIDKHSKNIETKFIYESYTSHLTNK